MRLAAARKLIKIERGVYMYSKGVYIYQKGVYVYYIPLKFSFIIIKA